MAANSTAIATGPTINASRPMPSPMSHAPAAMSSRHTDQAAARRTGYGRWSRAMRTGASVVMKSSLGGALRR